MNQQTTLHLRLTILAQDYSADSTEPSNQHNAGQQPDIVIGQPNSTYSVDLRTPLRHDITAQNPTMPQAPIPDSTSQSASPTIPTPPPEPVVEPVEPLVAFNPTTPISEQETPAPVSEPATPPPEPEAGLVADQQPVDIDSITDNNNRPPMAAPLVDTIFTLLQVSPI